MVSVIHPRFFGGAFPLSTETGLMNTLVHGVN